ncbi:hypothetical protein LOY54_06075 [Pseudomonas sp. B21-032]|uniref:hypothetical protein n=1 Tax=Pseudomonas sp. B21-032 TaxID=2895483 RepID=UPI00215F7774|nr:hypothetical protein [Pseudomonas sp. B21-032]UVL62837.1 hypothetical protein LOY54_06075 [Pseudomonas sp. B21-032]
MKRRQLLRFSAFGAAAAAISGPLMTSAAIASAKDQHMVSVAEFGIVPDGKTNWENTKNWLPMLLASVETGVYWPPGYYATGINFNRSLSGARMHFQPGAVLGGVVHMISGPQPRSFEITKIQRSAGVVTVNVKSAHSFQVGDSIQVRNVSGERSEFNGDRYRVTAADGVALQYIESKPDDVGALLRASAINETPLMNVRITGVLTTTDRLGTINCKNCYIESCWILNDPERHSAVPGGGSRGAHIYAGTDGLRIDRLVIDYAGGPNTAAALAIDGHGWNPSNCTFGFVHIKNSAFHGAYITGFGHRIDNLVIDAFAAENTVCPTLQDSNGIEQSNEIKGLWVNRCWDTHIRRLSMNQKNDGKTQAQWLHALIEDTGNTLYGVSAGEVEITEWVADSVGSGGVRFGDAEKFKSLWCNFKSKVMRVNTSSAFSGGAPVLVNATVQVSRVDVEQFVLNGRVVPSTSGGFTTGPRKTS